MRSALEGLQHGVAQAKRVAFAPLGELDDLLGDSVRLGVVVVAHAERPADVGVGAGHGRDRLRFEGFVLEKAVDGHLWYRMPRMAVGETRPAAPVGRKASATALCVRMGVSNFNRRIVCTGAGPL